MFPTTFVTWWDYALWLALMVGASVLLLVSLLIIIAFLLLMDRKVWAAVQLRRGPNVVGPFGLLQSFADLLKFVLKEPVIPAGADKGSAVRALMAEAPFAGRLPVFVGDDTTDEDGIAAAHDLGGVGLGSFSPAAQDVFSESLPTPPVKVVRDGLLQDDIADMWVRRSRVPMMIGLDLRAKVGSNTVGRDRMLAVIQQYGADTVKAVMKRMMSDAESRLRGKLRNLPDGT